MAYKVVITEDADRDLDRILAYLTQQLYSEQAASTLVAEYAQVLEQLEQFPSMCEVAHSVSRAGKEYRKFLLGNYVGVYRVQEREQQVVILRIFHGSQNYAKYL